MFRPDVAWARALVGAVALALFGLCIVQTFESGWLLFAREERGPWTYATWIGAANYAWSSLEAWHHHRMLRRRQRLGLADPSR